MPLRIPSDHPIFMAVTPPVYVVREFDRVAAEEAKGDLMAGWIDHPEFGKAWDNGCVVIVDDPSMLEEPILHEWLRDEEHVAVYSPDEWIRHINEEYQKDRLGTAIREAELEGWNEQAEALRRLLN